MEEEEVDISFSLPKPKAKTVKEKKAAVKAAAEEAAEDDSGATGAAAESVVVRGGKLRDLEVLTIGSDPIDKTSEAAEKAADTAAEKAVCPLVAAMLAGETAETSEAVKAEKEKIAVAAEEEATAAATAEDQRWQKGQRIQTKSLLAMKRDNRKVVETDEERVERLKQGLVQSMW